MQKRKVNRKLVVIWEIILHFSIRSVVQISIDCPIYMVYGPEFYSRFLNRVCRPIFQHSHFNLMRNR